jgi:hypothetical protein
MAAVTPINTRQVSVGSLSGIVADFAATTDNADTWATTIENIVWIGATQEDTAGTQAATGAGASFAADGTITFHIGEDNSAVRLLVLYGSAQ